jgi:drug/metabolite transporter (DMT)-like permease
MKKKAWLYFALTTTLFWGVWGAFTELSEKAGFPATMTYVVWSLTMVPCSVIALKIINWKLEFDIKSIFLGVIVGFLGAGGAILIFIALSMGPAYLIFPIISLSPIVTILFAVLLLRERAGKLGWIGIVLAVIAIPLLSYQTPGNFEARGYLWIVFSLIILIMWGVQAYVMKIANRCMKAESIFFYMALTGIILLPIALWLTDFSEPINWGFSGPYLAAIIQLLNAIGALFLVYAFRYGDAIVVSPLVNAGAPVITIIISLIIYATIPAAINIIGMVLAISAAIFLSFVSDD